MSRHLALDPRESPVQVTMPRQGQPPDGSSAETVAPQAVPEAESATDVAAEVPPTRRRAASSLQDQPLPKLRPAARHHSGVEHKGLRRPARPVSGKATAPRGMGLSKALLTLLASALIAALAGAWAYHSWSDNRALSRSGSGPAKAQVVVLDGVADTSNIDFVAGRTEQVSVSVQNPNPRPVAVQGIEPGKVVLSQPVPPACSSALVKAVAEHNDLVIPPGDGVFDATVAMSADAPPDCRGIAFSVTFVVTGTVTTP